MESGQRKVGILYRDGDYVIEHSDEDAWLSWPGGRIHVGAFYGDPSCAVINARDGWCAAGGDGLVICLFEGGMPTGSAPVDPGRIRRFELWRGSPPSFDDRRFIEGAWLWEDDFVRVLVDPMSEHAGLYDVNVWTRQWKRV